MPQLDKLQVAVIATHGVEESEFTEPVKALDDAGAKVTVIAPQGGQIQAFRHHDKSIALDADIALSRTTPGVYDALLLPGGALNADALRMNPEVQSFIRAFQGAGKPMAVICHAPWELISAGVVRGRKLTSYYTIQDDVRNAGGDWVDQEVVRDRNWVTSRQPSDIPAFNQELISLFSHAEAHTLGR